MAAAKLDPIARSGSPGRRGFHLLLVSLAVLAGVFAATYPEMMIPTTVGILGIGLLWTIPFAYISTALLIPLTVGVALFERQFTHVMTVSRPIPIYVVEFVLLVLAAALLFSVLRGKNSLGSIPLLPILIAFIALGFLHVIRSFLLYGADVLLSSPIQTGSLQVEVLRDSAMVFYAFFYLLFFVSTLAGRLPMMLLKTAVGSAVFWACTIVLTIVAGIQALPGNKLLLGFYSIILFGLFSRLSALQRFALLSAWIILMLNNILSENVSRALLVALSGSFAFMFLIDARPKARRVRTGFLIALTLLAVMVAVAYSSESASLLRPATVNFRVGTWNRVIDRAIDRPLLGWSFGIPIVTIQMLREVGSVAPTNDPHNSFLALFFRMGLVGLSLLVLITILFYKRCIIVMRHSTSAKTHDTLRVVLGCHFFLIGFGFFNQMLESPHFGIWYWALMGIGMAVAAVEAKSMTPYRLARI